MLAKAATITADKKVNAYNDGSSLLKMLAKAATTRGDKKVKTRASARGKYCREPYIVAMLAKPTMPRTINSHFLQDLRWFGTVTTMWVQQCAVHDIRRLVFQQCCRFPSIPSEPSIYTCVNKTMTPQNVR